MHLDQVPGRTELCGEIEQRYMCNSEGDGHLEQQGLGGLRHHYRMLSK